ncbi:unnamed protein product [Soboliphyme baturini]|uniref:Actin-related protein 6 n=1 Tax=Soboliphyme baturini TaxID=241478 RepID=A0A183J6N0_9BILA|nr:unnamed protein product [Soboliphyme baturini]
MDEMVFEEYGFQSALRINPSSLSMYKYMKENPQSLMCVVIDSGYSFTHVVPYFRGRQIKNGILR